MRPMHMPPPDADARRAVAPVACYPVDALQRPDAALLRAARRGLRPVQTILVPPRDGRVVQVARGQVLRVTCHEGTQVGDMNFWAADNLEEKFFSGKTRALHGTHISTGDRLWSVLPHLRPMATVLTDTLDWYGSDPFGGRVHDVIGTRCDPYTNRLLSGGTYHHCCHSNLTRALADATGMTLMQAEAHVHDVLNVFMCTGFDRAEGRYFMKASPARKGDYIEFVAEIDLLVGLSTCPGGDCGKVHSSSEARCHPLQMTIFAPDPEVMAAWPISSPNTYNRSHGR